MDALLTFQPVQCYYYSVIALHRIASTLCEHQEIARDALRSLYPTQWDHHPTTRNAFTIHSIPLNTTITQQYGMHPYTRCYNYPSTIGMYPLHSVLQLPVNYRDVPLHPVLQLPVNYRDVPPTLRATITRQL